MKRKGVLKKHTHLLNQKKKNTGEGEDDGAGGEKAATVVSVPDKNTVPSLHTMIDHEEEEVEKDKMNARKRRPDDDDDEEQEGEAIEMLVMNRDQLRERVQQHKDAPSGNTATTRLSAKDFLSTGAVATKRIIGGVVIDINNPLPLDGTKRLKTTTSSSPGGSSTGKRKPGRVWRPTAEYQLVREGPVLECHPNVHPNLQEHMMVIFKNTNPEVKFAADPKTPLWIGVLKLSPEMGYKEGEYYKPKLEHLKVMYVGRSARMFPADNLAIPIDGGDPLPYWIDRYKQIKDNEKSQKKKSKEKHNNNNNNKLLKKARTKKTTTTTTTTTNITNTNTSNPTTGTSTTSKVAEEHDVVDMMFAARSQHLYQHVSDIEGSSIGGTGVFAGGIKHNRKTGDNDVDDDDDDDDDDDEEDLEKDEAPGTIANTNTDTVITANTTNTTMSAPKKKKRRSAASSSSLSANLELPSASKENLVVDGVGIPDFDKYVMPLTGWMYTTTMMKGASKQTISKSSMLKTSPADKLTKTGAQMLQQIGGGCGGCGDPGVAISAPDPVPTPTPKTKALMPTPVLTTKIPDSVVGGGGNSLISLLDVKLAKHSFASAQIEAYKRGDVERVNPLFRAYLSGAKGMADPSTLLADFVDFLG